MGQAELEGARSIAVGRGAARPDPSLPELHRVLACRELTELRRPRPRPACGPTSSCRPEQECCSCRRHTGSLNDGAEPSPLVPSRGLSRSSRDVPRHADFSGDVCAPGGAAEGWAIERPRAQTTVRAPCSQWLQTDPVGANRRRPLLRGPAFQGPSRVCTLLCTSHCTHPRNHSAI